MSFQTRKVVAPAVTKNTAPAAGRPVAAPAGKVAAAPTATKVGASAGGKAVAPPAAVGKVAAPAAAAVKPTAPNVQSVTAGVAKTTIATGSGQTSTKPAAASKDKILAALMALEKKGVIAAFKPRFPTVSYGQPAKGAPVPVKRT